MENQNLSSRAEKSYDTARSTDRMGEPEITNKSPRGEDTGRLTERDQIDTFRTTMSTSRVYTALAALAAEKQALVSKLEKIDVALETEKKKSLRNPKQQSLRK